MLRSHVLSIITLTLAACSGTAELDAPPEPEGATPEATKPAAFVDDVIEPAVASAESEPVACAQARHAAADAPDTLVDADAFAERPSTERGPATAPVTVVLFSDFECPFCEKASHTVDALRERYGDDVRIVFKNRPLPMHVHAEEAARAALAAAEQGRFWDYHDAVFASEGPLNRATLVEIAAELGLDLRRFERDLDSDAIAASLAADLAEASALDVRGTPTFFVNGRRETGAQSEATFRGIIDRVLSAPPGD